MSRQRIMEESSVGQIPQAHHALVPGTGHNRWRRAWTDKDRPSELQAQIDAVTTGHRLDLHCRI
ncbi:hypothetical protein ABZ864_38190 [Streptomyces sp. NPDC047082]|uniref:hypothetical protein n=1 Tax=Streptomyces sp. NPDC047082 TaxID=3155259 RepID=UPI0033C69363